MDAQGNAECNGKALTGKAKRSAKRANSLIRRSTSARSAKAPDLYLLKETQDVLFV